jgi:anti-sigma-K factor RskA
MTELSNHQLLTGYLLGSLSDEETARLDELSITDDEFATQLRVAENDLVDSHVRRELSPEAEAEFRSAYLTSPKRREKVMFAETLLGFQRKAATAPNVMRAGLREKRGSSWRIFPIGLPIVQWAAAGAAIALLMASVFLATRNQELRQRLSHSQSEQAILAQQTHDLRRQLEARTPAQVTGRPEASEQPIDHLKVAAFILLPALRSASTIPIVSVSRDTDLVVLKLELEPSDFVKYRVDIQDMASRQPVWHGADLKPLSDGQRQAVSFAVRPTFLKQGNYLIRLQGVRANGSAELFSTYPFKTLLK